MSHSGPSLADLRVALAALYPDINRMEQAIQQLAGRHTN